MQAVAELGPAGGRDAVDRAHSAARDALLRDRRDQPVLFELPDRIIKRADVDIDVAFDHRRFEPALDLVGVKVAAVEHAENEQPCVHSIIKLIRFD